MLRRIAPILGVAATVWGLLIIFADGGQVHFLGLKLSSRHPFLLFWGGVTVLAIDALVWRPAVGRRIRSLGSLSARQASIVVAVVAILTGTASRHWGSAVVGGADSYGYLSEAGLWAQHDLVIQGDLIRQSPWPLAIETWAPLGYRPAAGRIDAVAPLYPPGLPIAMALLQSLFGYCAAFLVVPIAAAASVALTFVLGVRVFASSASGGGATPACWAALLVASSPVFLFQSMNPMTDVPAVAAWTLAFVLAVADWPLAGGLATSVALAIRPNLILVAAALALWTAAIDWRDWRSMGRLPTRVLRLGVGILPAVIGIAWMNAHLFGSPISSGYGSVESLYSFRHFAKNLSQFTTWIVDTQTPIVVASALFFVAPRWIGTARVPFPRLLFGGVLLAVALSYLFYLPFEGWTYLRFLLPMWPVMMLATTVAIDAVVRRWGRPASTSAGSLAQLLALVCVTIAAVRGVQIARDRGTFEVWRGERKYADVGRYLAEHTDPRAVILSFQHSGSIRLYGDRLTLRWDQLDVAWLDRVIDHLASTGRHPYIVVDGEEAQLFRTLFGNLNRTGSLDWMPMAALQRPYVAIYDAADREDRRTDVISTSGRGPAGWRCTPPQRWPTPVRME